MRADAFLTGCHQMRGLKPKMKLDVAGFKNRVHCSAELELALQTALQSRSRGIAANNRDTVHSAAVRAYWTIRPDDAFEPRVSSFFTVEMRFGKDAHDNFLSH